MSYESINLLAELVKSPAFVLALDELVAEEVAKYNGDVRHFVRQGNLNEALAKDAACQAIESLPALFRDYAGRRRV